MAKGKEPKFIKPSDKFSSTEGENVFCFLEVQGDPVPKVTWFKVPSLVSSRVSQPTCPDVQGPGHGAQVQDLDVRPEHRYPWLPEDEARR